MGFDGIKHSFGKNAARLWRVDQGLRKKVIFARANPARAASQIASAVADTVVAGPLKAATFIAIDMGKAVVEPAVWAAKGAAIGTKGAYEGHKTSRLRAKERSEQTWVRFDAEDIGQEPQVDEALIDQLRNGLIGAFAKADALSRTQKTVKVSWSAYGSHTGYMLAVKAAKAVLLAAVAHTPGLNHLALAHLLSPASEERILDSLGLDSVPSQLGVSAGILSAAHDGFAKSLRNTNLWEKDLETRQYQKEQVGVRRDILSLEGALKSIESLKSMSATPPSSKAQLAKGRERDIKIIQKGLIAAQRLQADISGDGLGTRFFGLSFNTQNLSSRADIMLQRYGLQASQNAVDFDALSAAPRPDSPAQSEQDVKGVETPSVLLPQNVRSYLQRRKLQGDETKFKALAARYLAEGNALKTAGDDDTAAIDPQMRLKHVDNKRKLAKARSRLAKTRLRILKGSSDVETNQARVEALEERIKNLESAIAAFRDYAAHPAVLSEDRDWRMIMPRYAAEMNLLEAEVVGVKKKMASVDAALAMVKSVSQRQVLKSRNKKLAAKLLIATLKQENIGLDLALAQKETRRLPSEATSAYKMMDRFSDYSVIENRIAYAGRLRAITVATGAREVSADGQRRTSHYVRPNTAPILGAPSIVNTVLKSAWYSVAVVPLINLPYWGAVRAHAAWSNYRFLQIVQRVSQDV